WRPGSPGLRHAGRSGRLVIGGDGCSQGEHLELFPGGQRLAAPGVAVALRVIGSPPQRRERARRQVAAGQLAVGEQFVVWPGEKIATDGVVVSGASAVDTSMLT